MAVFWLIIIVTILAVSLAVIWPILQIKSQNVKSSERKKYDISIYKEQLREIKRDLNTGLIAKDTAEIVQTELEHKILHAEKIGKNLPAASPLSKQSRFFIATSLVVFCTFGSLFSYNYFGSPTLPGYTFSNRKDLNLESSEKIKNTKQVLRERIGNLLKSLDENPKNIHHWRLLGDTLISAGHYDGAEEAFLKAYKINPSNTNIGADYAEARILNNKGKVDSFTMKILGSLIYKTPHFPKALFYFGLGKAQSGNYKEALQNWVNARALSSLKDPWVPILERQIAKISKKSGIDSNILKPSIFNLSPKKVPNSILLPMKTPENQKASSSISKKEQTKMVKGMVERLANRLKQNPNNPDGWARLAKSYKVLGLNIKAQYALQQYEKARKNTKTSDSKTTQKQ